MADIDTETMGKESIMGVKTAKKTITKKKSPRKKMPPLSSRVNRLDEAMVSMTAKMAASNAKFDARLDKAMASMATAIVKTDAAVAKMAASEAMLTQKMAELSERVDKTSETVDKLSERVDKTSASVDKMSERVDKLSETVDKLSERVDKTSETVDKLSERVDKTSASVDKMSERVDKMSERMDNLGLNVGGINNSIGKVVEMVLLPGLMEKLNTQFGYQFDNISPNKIFTAGGKQYAEVDLFLENGDAVMAVEAKTLATKDEIIKHVNRLGRLREHEAKAGLTGKTIYAAIAGITFDADARELARSFGMYLVELDHSNTLITIEPPAGAVGKW